MSKRPVFSAAAAAAAILIAVGLQICIQRTEAYAIAIAHVVSMPEVKELGEPIKTRLKLFDFHMSVSGVTGEAEFAVRASGPAEEVVVDVQLKQELGKWIVTRALIRE